MTEQQENNFNKFYNFWSSVSDLKIGKNLEKETIEELIKLSDKYLTDETNDKSSKKYSSN
jgi:hypothetical protein